MKGKRKTPVKTRKRTREIQAFQEQHDDILAGLTIVEDGNYVKLDDALIKRLKDKEQEPVNINRPNPFLNTPEYIEVIKDGTPITMDLINKYSTTYHSSDNQHMGEMIGNLPLDWLALKRSEKREDNWDYSVKVTGQPKVNDQYSTGRCWLFSWANSLRLKLIQKFQLDPKFDLSESYLFFYDKVERANLFLEHIWSLRHLDIQDRKVRMLTNPSSHFLSDGGFYSYCENLVNKYGIVPKNVYGEGFNTMVSAYMNEVLVIVLNHMALEIFNNKEWEREEFDVKKDEYNSRIYDLVVRFLGEPPKPTDTFTWTYKDENGETHMVKNLSPEKFFRVIIPSEENIFTIIHDPRHPETYFSASVVEYGLNVQDGTPITLINLPMDEFKKVIYESLKGDDSVWMACCMGKSFDDEENTSDTKRFDYEAVLGTEINLDKGDMLDMLTAVPNHAMLFIGCDAEEDGTGAVTKYKKWRTQNSWGCQDSENAPDNGYHKMTDDYFDKYVYEAAVNIKYFDPEVLKTICQNLGTKPFYTYKYTDAFGVVAMQQGCEHCKKNRRPVKIGRK